jgi:hypothetical protein
VARRTGPRPPGITRHGKRVRSCSTVDRVNALEQEKVHGKAGRIANSLLRMDLVILDGLGYLPFSQAGGALLDRLTHHCRIVETGEEAIRFSHSTAEAKKRIQARELARRAAKPSPNRARSERPLMSEKVVSVVRCRAARPQAHGPGAVVNCTLLRIPRLPPLTSGLVGSIVKV